jgi:hypothetical protein
MQDERDKRMQYREFVHNLTAGGKAAGKKIKK